MPKIKKYNAIGMPAYSHAQLTDHAPNYLREAIRPKVPGVIYNLDGTPFREDLDTMTYEQRAKKGMAQIDLDLEHSRLLPQEVEYVKENMDSILKYIVDNRLEYTYKPSDSYVDNAMKSIKNNYTPLTSKERKERAKISETLRQKFSLFSAKHEISVRISSQAFSGKPLDRTEECALSTSCTPEALTANERRVRMLRSGNPKLVAEAYKERIDELLSFDIENFDVTNDQYIADNFEKCEEIISSAPEMKAMINKYLEYYYVTPEQKSMFEKLGAITDVAYILRAKVDTLTSPIYSQIRTEEFYNNQSLSQMGIEVEKDGDIMDLSYDQALGFEDGEHREYSSAFAQIGFVNSFYATNPLFDKTLTPQERYQRYAGRYWDEGVFNEVKPAKFITETELKDIAEIQENEVVEGPDENVKSNEEPKFEEQPVQNNEEPKVAENPIQNNNEKVKVEPENEEAKPENEEVKVDPENEEKKAPSVVLPNINQFRQVPKDAFDNDGYDDFATEFDQLDENAEKVSDDDIHVIHDNTANEIAQEKADDEELLKTEEGQKIVYEKQLRANIESIKKIIPDFKITEEQIKEYVSPKRFELRKKSNEYMESFKRRKEVKKSKNIELPLSFARCYSAYLKEPGTPENDKYNEDFINGILDPSAKGVEFKNEVFAQLLSDIQSMDDSKFNKSGAIGDLAEYLISNLDLWEKGFEFQNTRDSMISSLGLDVKDEFLDDVSKIRDKAVSLGGIGRLVKDAVNQSFFFTFPYDQLTFEQLEKLEKSTIFRNSNITPHDFANMELIKGSFTVNVGTYEMPSNHKYTKDDFKIAVPKLDDFNNKIRDFAKRLHNTDHFYNFNNSPEFKNMIAAVDSYLEDAKNPYKLRDNMLDRMGRIHHLAQDYIDHVAKEVKAADPKSKALGKNDNQIARRQIADELRAFTSTPYSDVTYNTMVAQHIEAIENKPIEKMSDELAQDQEFQRKNAIFNAGLKRTEELRTSIDKLPNGYKKEIGQIAIDARDYLTEMVGRTDFNVTKVKQAMATVIAHSFFAQSIKDMPDNEQSTYQARHAFEKSARDLCSNQAFINLTKEIDSDMINQFLEASGEQAFVKKMVGNIYAAQGKPEQPENELENKLDNELEINIH